MMINSICHLFIVGCFLCGGFFSCTPANAQRANTQSNSSQRDSEVQNSRATRLKTNSEKTVSFESLTPEQQKEIETKVFDFIREHHAEIEPYLKNLKTKSPQQYRRGVGEIAKNIKRLEFLKERNPSQHVFNLKIWKLDSRTRLTAIRYAVSEDEKFKDELIELLNSKAKLQHERAIAERERLQKRLDKLNQNIEEMNSNQDEFVQKRADQLLQRIEGQLKRSQKRKK